MKIYTIGHSELSAQDFFGRLRENAIRKLIDVRILPNHPLAGFARQDDLPYFLMALANGCQYAHMPMLGPTEALLEAYRADEDWPRYVAEFEALMDVRNIPAALDPNDFGAQAACLLCAEATPEQCHRRLVAERLAAHWPAVTIVHL